MSDLVTRAELQALADGLGVDAAKVAQFDRLGAEQLHALRMRISDKLFDEQAAMFSRVSKLAPLVPNALVAKLSQAMVPPLAAGRAAGALGVDHQGRIADLLSRLSPKYMADCAPHLDPRAIAIVAPIVDGKSLVPAAKELMRRKAYVTAAQFVEHSTPQLIRDFERGIDDDAGLLLTAACVYSTEKLCEVIRQLPRARVERIVVASARSSETRVPGLAVLSRLDAELVEELGRVLFDALDDAALDEVLQAALDADALDELRDVLAKLSPDARERALARPPLAGFAS